MQAFRVVVDPAFFDDFESFADAGETVLVQAFLAVSAVETLDTGGLGGVRRVRKQRGALFSRRTGR